MICNQDTINYIQDKVEIYWSSEQIYNRIVHGRTLKKRPKAIYKRLELGHWEGDTVESGRNDRIKKSKYCFVTLVERKSRFTIAIRVKNRTSKNVTPAIINALKGYPKELVKTITFDRGKEFSGYIEIEN